MICKICGEEVKNKKDLIEHVKADWYEFPTPYPECDWNRIFDEINNYLKELGVSEKEKKEYMKNENDKIAKENLIPDPYYVNYYDNK